MSPRTLVISTTYKTRVALEKPCKKRQGIVIGQVKDSQDLKRKFSNFEDIGSSQTKTSCRDRGWIIQECSVREKVRHLPSRCSGQQVGRAAGSLEGESKLSKPRCCM